MQKKFYKSFIVIIIIASLVTFSFKKKTIMGTYVSRESTYTEATSLMYSKGYVAFLEVPDNYIKLIIEKDSTFVYSIKKKEYPGSWRVNGKTLILNFADASREKLELKIRNNKLYNITEEILCKSKKKMMRLMLLEKQPTK